jgi:hypothetical protein
MNTPTPETDSAWDKYINFPYSNGAGDLRILAQRLERERDEARELAQQMSESNQVLQAEVRDYRKTADNTPLSNNEMHLNLVLQEVAKLAKTLKRERDEAREALKVFRLNKHHCDSHRDMLGNCIVCQMEGAK